jgi:MFS transporter, MHS family, proline/betaine transporter
MLKEHSSYIVAILATIVRYYDYALFGLSASVISRTFMSGANDSDQMLLFFAVFSIAVIARPIGSILFGKIGDQVSRIASVKIATIFAAISTSLIAFIPSFDSWGWFSIVLITLCRMMFLMSLTGEIDGIKIFVAEKIGAKRRNLAIGIVSFSSQLGVILASIMYHLAINIELIEWAWRLNFVLGGILGLVVISLRGNWHESQSFLNNKSRVKLEVESNIFAIVAKNKMKFFLSMMVNGMLGGGYHFLIIFLGTFAANIADIVDPGQASSNNVILIILYGFSCLFSGYIADKVDVIKQISGAIIISIICVIIMEIMISKGEFSFIFHKVLAFIVPFYSIPCAIKVQSLFSTGIRMRMYSLSHSVGSMVFSSTTPFVCMLLWQGTGLFSIVLAYFLFQLIILLFAITYLARKEYDNQFEA